MATHLTTKQVYINYQKVLIFLFFQ